MVRRRAGERARGALRRAPALPGGDHVERGHHAGERRAAAVATPLRERERGTRRGARVRPQGARRRSALLRRVAAEDRRGRRRRARLRVAVLAAAHRAGRASRLPQGHVAQREGGQPLAALGVLRDVCARRASAEADRVARVVLRGRRARARARRARRCVARVPHALARARPAAARAAHHVALSRDQGARFAGRRAARALPRSVALRDEPRAHELRFVAKAAEHDSLRVDGRRLSPDRAGRRGARRGRGERGLQLRRGSPATCAAGLFRT